jgi:hypothetical protein
MEKAASLPAASATPLRVSGTSPEFPTLTLACPALPRTTPAKSCRLRSSASAPGARATPCSARLTLCKLAEVAVSVASFAPRAVGCHVWPWRTEQELKLRSSSVLVDDKLLEFPHAGAPEQMSCRCVAGVDFRRYGAPSYFVAQGARGGDQLSAPFSYELEVVSREPELARRITCGFDGRNDAICLSCRQLPSLGLGIVVPPGRTGTSGVCRAAPAQPRTRIAPITCRSC